MKLGFTTGTQILKKSQCNGSALAHPPPKKFRTQPSASKVMATVFWDSKGIILIDYKPAGTSVTGEYYANVIKQLRVAIKEKRRGKLAAGVLLLHDNAPVHKSRVAQAAIRVCKFAQLNHPPYSPDLAPSDYYLFRNLKSHLRGTRFRDDDELKAATEAWFEDQIDDFYFKGIDCLKEKWAPEFYELIELPSYVDVIIQLVRQTKIFDNEDNPGLMLHTKSHGFRYRIYPVYSNILTTYKSCRNIHFYYNVQHFCVAGKQTV